MYTEKVYFHHFQNTHDKVRRRALGLVAEWTADFEKDPSLGIMEECYDNLKSKGKLRAALSDNHRSQRSTRRIQV